LRQPQPFSVILAPKQQLGTEVDQTVYHVVLEGGQVGPYDRRTIVGMRIKETLTSDHVLIGADGTQLTVGDLIRRRSPTPFNAERSGSYSVVQGAYPASLVEVTGRGIEVPKFRGEIEIRVQADGVLRLAGRFRRGFGSKEGRVKIALKDVAHARVSGSQVQLGLRGEAERKPRQFRLELFTPQAADEFVGWLPDATPFPGSTPAASQATRSAGASPQAIWTAAISVLSVAIVVGVVLGVVLHRGGR
jgi:hypothetical protein